MYSCHSHAWLFSSFSSSVYGMATISRLLKTIGLFSKRALYKRLYSAKETYNFKKLTNLSHPISHHDVCETLLRYLTHPPVSRVCHIVICVWRVVFVFFFSLTLTHTYWCMWDTFKLVDSFTSLQSVSRCHLSVTCRMCFLMQCDISTHIHKHTQTHTQIHRHTQTLSLTHTRTHAHTCTQAHTCTNTHTHTHTCTHTDVHLHTYTHTRTHTHTPTHTRKHTHTHTQDMKSKKHGHRQGAATLDYFCTHMRTRACACSLSFSLSHTHTYTHTHTHIRMHIHHN